MSESASCLQSARKSKASTPKEITHFEKTHGIDPSIVLHSDPECGDRVTAGAVVCGPCAIAIWCSRRNTHASLRSLCDRSHTRHGGGTSPCNPRAVARWRL